jgi:hypothetical protein
MQRIFRGFLVWTILLSACSTGVASPQPASPTAVDVPSPTTVAPDPKLIATLSTPHIDQGPDGKIRPTSPSPQNCGYQWATRPLPELSNSLLASLQALQPEAQANAYAFGENCMLPDGSVGGFAAMETDFNITLQVNDLTDESELGEWIVKAMQVIEAVPPDQIVGPLPGQVNLIFLASGAQEGVNFHVNQFQTLPGGLSNPEIYQALKFPQ